MTGMFMGTPGYLAPEVIEGAPSGPAADVHSWGATMAFAATGRPPFGTGAFEAIFYRIVHGEPDLSSLPTALLPLVLAALARDPARRPTSADLCALAAGLQPAAMVPGPAQPAGGLPGGLAATRTALDLPGASLRGPDPRGNGAGQSPTNTRPLPQKPRQLRRQYADLLPPVSYQAGQDQAALAARAAGRPEESRGAVRPGPCWLSRWPGRYQVSLRLPVPAVRRSCRW